MKSPYICASHINRIVRSEEEAMRHWTELLNRGWKAYQECRLKAAEIYLSAAIDVALLRIDRTYNAFFSSKHIWQPTEILAELLYLDERPNAADTLLTRIHSMVDAGSKPTCEPMAQGSHLAAGSPETRSVDFA